MPISMDGVAAAIGSGVSAVCAACTRYWEARDKAIPGSKCMSRVSCGSPMAGDAFSNYRGPLAGALEHWCFVCANKSIYGVSVAGKNQRVGVCEKHLNFVRSHRAVGGPDVVHGITSINGDVAEKKAVAKRSLATDIAEAEKSFQEQDIKNGLIREDPNAPAKIE